MKFLTHSRKPLTSKKIPFTHLPVSAKMRLGHRDDSRMIENAQAIAAGGACELVVHARTKLDGYRPPAYWDRIADIRAAVRIPIVANGEIWTVADAERCREASGCEMLMLGRGMVADPGLAMAIRFPKEPRLGWPGLWLLLRQYWLRTATHVAPNHRTGRIKQWLNLLRRRHPEAQTAFDSVRTITDVAWVDAWLTTPRSIAHPARR